MLAATQQCSHLIISTQGMSGWTSFLFQSQRPDISCVQIYYALCTQTTYNGSGCSGSCCSGGFFTQTHSNLPTVSGIGTLFFLFYRRGQVTCTKPHSHQWQRQGEPSAVCSEPAGILLLMCAGYCKFMFCCRNQSKHLSLVIG